MDPEVLFCPISGDIMKDPVLLVQSGMTYDRQSLCQSLRVHPYLDPVTNVRYQYKLTYVDNVLVRKLLIQLHGDEAYKRYDDRKFLAQYHKHVDDFLYGEFERLVSQGNFEAALYLASKFPFDAVMVCSMARIQDCISNGAHQLWERALELRLPDLAESGDARAQYYLGYAYLRGRSVQRDLLKAHSLIEKAAKQGLSKAQLLLGCILRGGCGVPEDLDEAKRWFVEAAKQGEQKAQNVLKALSQSAAGPGRHRSSSSLY